MNYYISKLIIWFKNGTSRELEFLPNKVNVITGRSNTGKTAIIDIIDYCFFASKSKISHDTINENSAWYSIVINYDGNPFTFARKAPEYSNVSDEYYFTNKLDSFYKVPYQNSDKNTLKSFFESIFKIDSNAKVEYGGSFHTKESKISLRYFQMFNTISGNIIENDSGVFFDKQNEDRYREALPRVFDLAVGIETVENIVRKDTVNKLSTKLKRIEGKNKKIENKSSTFAEEQSNIISLAKKYSLINPELDKDTAWKEISSVKIDSVINSGQGGSRDALEKEYYATFNKIKKLNNFDAQYQSYKKSLSVIENKIKPIEYLKMIDHEIIKTSIFDEITTAISEQLLKIKFERNKKTPLTVQVQDKIADLEEKLNHLKQKIEEYPEEEFNYSSSNEKFYYLGQITAQAKIFNDFESEDKYEDTQKLKNQIDNISIVDTTNKRESTSRAIEEIVAGYMKIVSLSLENYKDYSPFFDYKNKTLGLRKPKSVHIENVGSSSNQMFLHLFFTLAMHDIIEQNNSPFVAPYLIIDQPSRPYYGDEPEEEKHLSSSDQSKIINAFKLLDSFIESRLETKSHFQMILLEHIPENIISDMKNVHIVSVFRDGNALVEPRNIGILTN
jgi:hypothetical protein